MKLALYQGPPIMGDPEAAFTRLNQQLGAAAAAGARMMVAPELFLPGYNQPDLHSRLAQPRGGEWCKRLADLAQCAGCGLTVGWAERDGGDVFNAATAFDRDGGTLGHYRKIQLFGPMETASFKSGSAYCLFDLDGMRTALLVCYDIEFAPHVRTLAKQGAQIVLVPTANQAGFEHISDVFIPARSGEMSLTIAYANYCGTEGSLEYGGRSLISGPDARPLATAGRSEALLVAEVAASVPQAVRSTQLDDFRKVQTDAS